MHNSPIHTMCNTIKNVMSSAVEAKTGGIFMVIQHTCPIRLIIVKIVHPQPSTHMSLYTDNLNAKGILTSDMRQKLSKSFDVRFYWVKYCIQKNWFDLIWEKFLTNMVDYITKQHSPWHQNKMWYKYLHKNQNYHQELSSFSVQGCVTSNYSMYPDLTSHHSTYPEITHALWLHYSIQDINNIGNNCHSHYICCHIH